ncbi:hypothetical protein CH92_05405 [Stutzerimonas stutzeri]|uniref:ABC-type transport auxiliary lipoprotein component domain-containing protein n=1 Tax=Stutzerimonas stutzeri TaxID=316 RepID=W8QVG0_STUST|nr:PqiC family protein [Stutzerimonas stutzeri]AHL74560.1 hypothetical protein CH92_05405 [Stutzerimonas stutzeri]MCQ4329088.1 PqiC family protein [Stutzerimonas stutzeri]
MTLRPPLLMLVSALILSACSSPATRYHTLIAAQPRTTDAVEPVGFQLQVLPVRIPVQADQPSLVVRESDGRLTILESALWASPPADEFHDALAIELEHRLGVRDLAGLPGRANTPVLSLRTDVRRFDSLPGLHAALDVVWNLEMSERGRESRTLTCASVIHEQAGAELDSLVLAHQRAIAGLADTIARTARHWATNPDGDCPQP